MRDRMSSCGVLLEVRDHMTAVMEPTRTVGGGSDQGRRTGSVAEAHSW